MLSLCPSLFAVSPCHGGEIAAICARAGWTLTLVDTPAFAAARFAADPAVVAIVDQRGAPACAAAAADIAADVERRHGALLVLVDATADIGPVHDAGATHVAVAPDGEALAGAIRLAIRAHERLTAAAGRRGLPPRAPALVRPDEARAWVERLLSVERPGDPAAIVLQLAIGRFGQLNAAYGRSVADTALRLVEERLCRAAATLTVDGQTDGRHWATRVVTRLAGAEFALILAPPATVADGATLARNVARAFDAPFEVDGHSIHLGCRIGIAAVRPTNGTMTAAAETAFRHASVALAAARARPPGAVEVFEAPDGTDPARRMADLEADLHAALEAGEVDVLFQPQVDVDTDSIVGVEALVRWHHPTLGQLPPETLLEVADSADFAIRLGTYIHRRALAAAARWPRVLDAVRLGINASARDLAAPGFVARLDAALAASGFPPGRLTIEVTESELVENLAETAAVLADVRARGIEMALDDFGTGYSSLAYLKMLPLDCLKVDKRLVADLAGSARDRIVVKSVVDMAHALGMRVVAEGVETDAQRARVAAAGCDAYQGFLCAAPLAADRLADFVGAWNARTVAA